jgi:hypothetical protein
MRHVGSEEELINWGLTPQNLIQQIGLFVLRGVWRMSYLKFGSYNFFIQSVIDDYNFLRPIY